jgi:hypothetical protein
MKSAGWKSLILSAVDKAREGDESTLDLLASALEEMDQAKQTLINKGYGCTGMGILEAVQNISVADDYAP